MPPYDLINLRYFLLMMGVGIGVPLLVVLARGATRYTFSFRRRSDAEIERSRHEFGGGVEETDRPVPLFIWLIILLVFLWAVGYTIYTGLFGL